MSSTRGKEVHMGYIHEEWSVDSVILGGLNFLMWQQANVVEVLLREHGELGGWISCWGEWKRTVVSARTQLFGNHKSIWNEHVSLSDQGLRSLLCSPRSSVFWGWKRARWMMYLTIEYGTDVLRYQLHVVTRFIVSFYSGAWPYRKVNQRIVHVLLSRTLKSCVTSKIYPTLSRYLQEHEFL